MAAVVEPALDGFTIRSDLLAVVVGPLDARRTLRQPLGQLGIDASRGDRPAVVVQDVTFVGELDGLDAPAAATLSTSFYSSGPAPVHGLVRDFGALLLMERGREDVRRLA